MSSKMSQNSVGLHPPLHGQEEEEGLPSIEVELQPSSEIRDRQPCEPTMWTPGLQQGQAAELVPSDASNYLVLGAMSLSTP